jgi:hypothetical protein
MLARAMLIAAAVGACGTAAAQPADPPQGYASLNQDFGPVDPVYWNGTQRGFWRVDLPLRLGSDPSALRGTFWALNFSFRDSSASTLYPAGYVGGDQGGYVGLQVLDDGSQVAIFSVWWARAAQAGRGATCLRDIEMWYDDDRPFEPPITGVRKVDTSRRSAGGPFMSCRLPVTLTRGAQYRVRIGEIADALQPDADEWWGAWLIGPDGAERLIGRIQTPGAWGWLNPGIGGFIEHFTAMPDGCASIPASRTVLGAAVADGGAYVARPAFGFYGTCGPATAARAAASTCSTSRCTIAIEAAPAP